MNSAANPIEINQIDHVVLRAREIDVMLAFYRDVLGCDLAKHNEELGLYHLRAGSAMIDLVDMRGKIGQGGGAAPGDEGHNVDHFALRIADYDEDILRAYLESHGVKVGEGRERFGAQGDGQSLYLWDPEGNGLELKGPSKP